MPRPWRDPEGRGYWFGRPSRRSGPDAPGNEVRDRLCSVVRSVVFGSVSGSIPAPGRVRSGAPDVEPYASPRTNHGSAFSLALDRGNLLVNPVVVSPIAAQGRARLGAPHVEPYASPRAIHGSAHLLASIIGHDNLRATVPKANLGPYDLRYCFPGGFLQGL